MPGARIEASDNDALMDLVDLEDNVVGALPRARLRETAANYRVAHVLVFDRRGRLLLQRLADARAATPTWGSSAAGHVHAGESYHDAALRELREELGVERADLRLVGKTWMDADGARKFMPVFRATLDGPFRPDPAEVAELAWMDPPAFPGITRSPERTYSPTFLHVFRLWRDAMA